MKDRADVEENSVFPGRIPLRFLASICPMWAGSRARLCRVSLSIYEEGTLGATTRLLA